jgi:hypothetical protein
MGLKLDDSVRINCPASKYHDVTGKVFFIQTRTQYVIVDMPPGTERQREGLRSNAIVEKMGRSAKTRKKPFKRWPKGDPEWFPVTWLEIDGLPARLDASEEEDGSESEGLC